MKRSRRENGPKWQPLVRSHHPPSSPAKIAAQIEMARRLMPALDEDKIREVIRIATEAPVWGNDRYTVHVNPYTDDVVQLSIHRHDRAPCRDWRDLQRIKNQLVGPEHEAIELYPAESRVVDTANEFHLWCFTDPTFRVPVGWFSGRVVSSESGAGAVQRPHEEPYTGPARDGIEAQHGLNDVYPGDPQ